MPNCPAPQEQAVPGTAPSPAACTLGVHSHVSRPAREWRPWSAQEQRQVSCWDLLFHLRVRASSATRQPSSSTALSCSSGAWYDPMCCSLCFASPLAEIKNKEITFLMTCRNIKFSRPPKAKKGKSTQIHAYNHMVGTWKKGQLQYFSWVPVKGRESKTRQLSARCFRPL